MIITPVIGNQHQLNVEIVQEVPTFFLKVLGFESVTVARQARAQFVPPLPMGSPDNQFGDGPECLVAPPKPGHCNNFVGIISGHSQGRGWGDLFTPFCDGWRYGASGVGCGSGDGTVTGENPEHRSRGYLYAVELPAGVSAANLQILSPGNNTAHQGTIGDNTVPGGLPRHTIRWTLYNKTTTPLVLDSTTPICSRTYPPNSETGAPVWRTFDCQPTDGPGIYPLQVQVDCTNCQGHNEFSIRATTSVGQPDPRVYALSDMAIYVQHRGSTSFFFAEVLPLHAGKTLVLELWDAGDSLDQPQNSRIQIVGPGDVALPCRFTYSPGGPAAPGNLLPDCEQATNYEPPYHNTTNCPQGNCFNNRMMTFRIPLPSSYSCSPGVGDGCWWKVRYIYDDPTAQPTDATTWSARIIGNPVHLVPDD